MTTKTFSVQMLVKRVFLCFLIIAGTCALLLLPLAYILAPYLIGSKVGLGFAGALAILGLYLIVRNLRISLRKLLIGAMVIGVSMDIVLVAVAQR